MQALVENPPKEPLEWQRCRWRIILKCILEKQDWTCLIWGSEAGISSTAEGRVYLRVHSLHIMDWCLFNIGPCRIFL